METSNWKGALKDYYSKSSSAKSGFVTDHKNVLPMPPQKYFDELNGSKFGKFPPPHPPPILLPILINEFVKQNLTLLTTSFSGNDKYDEIVAGIQFLEALLQTSSQKAVQHRSKLIELQKLVSSLSLEKRQRLILLSNELRTVKNVIDELLTLKVACTDLQRSDIQPEFSSDSVLRTLNLKNLEYALNKQELLKIESAVYSLVERAHSLSTAVDSTLKCIEGLIEHCQAVYYFTYSNPADDQLTKLKMIHIQWRQDDTKGWTACNRSYNFVSYMNSLSLPVCNEVCAFLQSPKDYAHGLLFPFGYVFAVNELAGIFNYFKLQHLLLGSMPTFSSYSVSAITKELVLCGCRLHDKDCHTLANHLSLFPSLTTLDLSSNEVSSSGVSSIIAALFTMGPICQLRFLALQGNNIDCNGLAVIGEALRSGKSLMRLEMLSVAENPVKNKGISELLKSTMNKHRKAYHFLRYIKWRALTAESELDDDSDDETLREQQQQASNSIMHNCFYSNYFHSSSISQTHQNSNLVADSDTKATIAGSWFTHAREGFWMDDNSDYSSSHEEDSDGDEFKPRVSVEKASNSPQQPEKKKILKLVAILIKLRLRIAAVNAFLRLRTRGHILSYLDISCCLFTKDVIRYIALVLKDNHNIKVLDMSNNKVLQSKESCLEISSIFTSSALHTVKLNGCEIADEGLQEIAKGIAESETLRSVELSDNHFGPTGANWVASLSRRYFVDDLVLRNGRRQKMAPFGTPIVPNASNRWKYSTTASTEGSSFYAQPREADFSSEVGGTLEEEEQQDWEQQSEELL